MVLDYSRKLNSDLAKIKVISENQIRTRAVEIDNDLKWPAENIKDLLNAGFGGLCVPSEFGGLGYGLLALAKICETVGMECASTSICFGMHCVGAAVLSAQATEEQAKKYLKPICNGTHLTTLALSEPGTGAHFYYPQCSLYSDHDEFILNGTKGFITNGGHADSYVVSAMQTGEGILPSFSCIVVDRDSNGITWKESWKGFGMRGNDSLTAEFKNVRLCKENLLGSEGDQTWYVFNVVAPYFLMAMSGVYLGVARTALNLAQAHLKNRKYGHNGRSLAEESIIQHRLASLWGKCEATGQLIYYAANRFDEGDEAATLEIMLAKAEIAEIATNIVNEAMTLMGGIAYRDGAQIQRCLRDVRAAHVMAPTTDLLRQWAGRILLDQPILGD
ncbi:MAG: acyl-CoA/acyl-ACP dehydrogenase [Kordiimonadaceae bacterium]|nr:acyl-CoA/acyl-ACP dehydrogenase [Kordiimonadaceae bacterium]